MKRIIAILTTACLILCLSACAGNSKTADTPSSDVVPKSTGKAIVVYFSRVGNTDFPDDIDVVSSATLNDVNGELKGNAQLMAEWIADEAGCETFEIVTQDSYPADYNQTIDLAKEEQNNDHRPLLKNKLEKADEYDTVYLVFPNWWADLPMAVYAFLDQYDLSGTTINVFVTHEGSRFSSTIDTIRELEPGATVTQALDVRGGSVINEENTIREWVRSH